MNIKKSITMNHLKIIAYITMLIDHIGAVLLEPKLLSFDTFMFLGLIPAAKPVFGDPINVLYVIFRYIGRIAFPIFCFNLVEGYYHTRDVKKYMLRLFILALLSEIPFDLSFAKSPFAMNYQNVIWCLLIGLICIYLSDKVFNKNILATILVFILGGVLATVGMVDYEAIGIIWIFVFYIFRENHLARNILITALSIFEVTAPIALIPIEKYNGEKGNQGKYFKLWNYFYPVHLLVLWIIYRIMYQGAM